jgi:hypothetical protein
VAFLEWLENTGTMTWIRESTSLLGYTLYLSAHTIGLVFMLGPVVIIGLRISGLLRQLPIAPLRSFFPLMAAGFAVNVASGLVLFATAPVGFAHNITFLVKLTFVILAAVVLGKFLQHVFGGGEAPDVAVDTPRARRLFAVDAALWAIAITAGRLTAYSAYVISRTVGAVAVALVVAVVAFLVARLLVTRRGHEETVNETLPSSLAVSLKGK